MPETGSDPAADDRDLVRRCLAGDEAAWNLLIERYRQRLIDLAMRIVPRAPAQDVVDAVMADVWEGRKLARYEGRSSLATWLGAVTLNAALNARRRITAHARVVGVAGSLPDVPAAASVGVEDALVRILHDAIAALPADARVLMLLYYEQNLTLDQAAALLRRSKSTLSRSLMRARDAIRREADRLARERYRTTLEELRAGADLSLLELDLRAACAFDRDNTE
jgi:RNA polymerase sigma-70 factor (ECF subfamily)